MTDLRRNSGDEALVVRDKDDTAIPDWECVYERVETLDIEVVSRLIEE